ncbi:MAG: lysostaphin resistance A-like protein [Rubripirellula sp.]
MIHAIYLTLNAVMLLGCVGCIALWVRVGARYLKSRRSTLAEADTEGSIEPTSGPAEAPPPSGEGAEEQPVELSATLWPVPRERPFWSAVDALVMYGLMLFLSTLAITVALSLGWMESAPEGSGKTLTQHAPFWAIGVSSAGGLAAALLTLTWLHLFAKNPLPRLGLKPSGKQIKLGLKASVMLLPPVLVISAVVSWFVPYAHPILDVLADMTSVWQFVVLFVATAIVTPFVEEFLFRVLMQGGLQAFADRFGVTDASWKPVAWWPVVVTSVVFAMLHFGQGAAPIPLFFLSLGLGFLYRQTGNITAPIVIHVVLNGLTVVAECVKPVS